MTQKPENIIRVTNLTKKFGSFKALDEFNLTVSRGEVHGFLGPNGAGKSTTIRVLLGLLRKSSGDVELFGQDPWKQAITLHKRLAYVPGDVSFWPNLSGGEIIDLMGDLRGGLNERRRQELLNKFELDPTKKFSTYSKGNRQKVALVAALASDVELYILDEPTSGLDPLMEAIFQQEIKALKQQNKTILLSSHILAEVEALCDQVTIIRKGKAIEADALGDIRKKHRSVMTVESGDGLTELGNLKGVYNVVDSPNGVQFEIDSRHTDDILKYLARYNISNITSHPPALEDLFLSHYDETSTGQQEK